MEHFGTAVFSRAVSFREYSKRKWRCCPMSNRLLPYDTIIKAHEGDPIAIQAVLDRYAGYIRYFSKMNGYYNSDMEDYIRTKLIESLFKFRLDR